MVLPSFVLLSLFLSLRRGASRAADESATRRVVGIRCSRGNRVACLDEVDDRGGIGRGAAVARQADGGGHALADAEVGRAARTDAGEAVGQPARAAEVDAHRAVVAR